MMGDFCIFILSHGRPTDIPTVDTLENNGYDGDWRIIIDHEGEYDEYVNEWGEDKILYFDKDEVVDDIDRMDNFDDRNCNLYARNKAFEFADELNYEYFMVLDDDYYFFQHRFDDQLNYDPQTPSDFAFNDYLNAAIKYLENAGLHTFCMAQGGDFIGGSEASFAEKVKVKRKAMNTFLFKTNRPVRFRGTINEDVTAYVREQQLGKLFLTTNICSVEQEDTQQEEGGLTDIYLDKGTYVKSFYTVLASPSSVTLDILRGRSAKRIHHRVDWNASVPKIVPESVKEDT